MAACWLFLQVNIETSRFMSDKVDPFDSVQRNHVQPPRCDSECSPSIGYNDVEFYGFHCALREGHSERKLSGLNFILVDGWLFYIYIYIVVSKNRWLKTPNHPFVHRVFHEFFTKSILGGNFFPLKFWVVQHPYRGWKTVCNLPPTEKWGLFH